jgi:predicted DNA binding CopG/RHH family protein
LQGIPYDTIVSEILHSAATRVGTPRRS